MPETADELDHGEDVGGVDVHDVTPPPSGPMVVGIGASAGGLPALRELLSRLPHDSGLAIVVVVHLSPDQESHLARLLQTEVAIPVEQVSETIGLQANRVYVIPPNRNLSTIDTHLRLTALEGERRRRAPIDHFFRTLARTHQHKAIAVVLTGTGSDGSIGLKEINEGGGLTVVQSPDDAAYDGMPRSAIATGAADLVLPVAEIAAAIVRFAGSKPQLPTPADGAPIQPDTEQVLRRIHAQIRSRTNRDFSRYKQSSILRRIRRRMQLLGHVELDGYLEVLPQEPGEIRALADDLLVTVSSFFRDPAVFDVLATDVVPSLFDGKRADEEIRVWSAGCATGEEAYSLAILLLEEAAEREAGWPIQVFASDLHEASLDRAREGFYPSDIELDVSPARLGRYFRAEDGGYRVRQEVRDITLFTPHNLLHDPPFSRLDLIACRNVLIYLQRDAQTDVAQVFHYALRPGGWLVLGSPENLGAAELFRAQDKKRCIYRKRNAPVADTRLPTFPISGSRSAPSEAETGSGGHRVAGGYGEIHSRMLQQLAPPSLLLDPDDGIVHLSGPVGQFLVHPSGDVTADVFKLVRADLAAELSATVRAARERNEPARSRPRMVAIEGERREIVITVRPATGSEEAGFALVAFETTADAAGPDPGSADAAPEAAGTATGADRAGAAGNEGEARRRSQAIIEEYQTGQEELKAANEELQSANEELRSTLEELETWKEELQLTNEELQTANQENRHKVAELAELSSDLQNLLAATDIATLFLDRQLHILRFTPKVTELFNVRATDRGRSLDDITHRLHYDELAADAAEVLRGLVPVERELGDHDGRWYLARVLPYRSGDDRIDGVVITFVDTTKQKAAEEAIRRSEQRFQATADQLPLLVWSHDPHGRQDWANATYRHYFGLEVDAVAGEQWRPLLHVDDLETYVAELEEAAAERRSFHAEVRMKRADGVWRCHEIWAQPRVGSGGAFEGHLVVSADITDRKQLESERRAAAAFDAFRARLIERTAGPERPADVALVGVSMLRELLDSSGVVLLEPWAESEGAGIVARAGGAGEAVYEPFRLDELGDAVVDEVGTGRTVVVDDVLSDSRLTVDERAATVRRGAGSYLLVPVLRHGVVTAAVFVQQSINRAWTSQEVGMAGEVAERIWAAVERARTDERVREEEARLRAMAEAVPGVLFTTDPSGRVDFVSGQVHSLLGVAPETVVGTRMWPDLIHPDDVAVASGEWERARDEDGLYESRYRICRSEGEIWILARAVPVVEGGRIKQWFGALTDVTSQVHTERALHELNESLEQRVDEGTRQVRELAATLSRAEQEERRRLSQVLHDDLQQQLYGVQLKLSISRSEAGDGELDEAMASLTEAERRLSDAIATTRSLTVDLQPPLLDSDDLSDALRWLVSHLADLHGLTVELRAGADPVGVGRDDLRVVLFHVARELLFNVAKHARTDQAVMEVAEVDGELILTVSDEGAGVDSEVLARATGIGIVRARHRLRLLGGNLEIDSSSGTGTRAIARVPLEPSS